MNVPAVNLRAGAGAVITLDFTLKGGEVRAVIVGGVAVQVVRVRNAPDQLIALRRAPAAGQGSMFKTGPESRESRPSQNGSDLL